MQINLSEHFTYKKLFRFTLPSVIMLIFTSIYGVVDGFFVSNFAGDTAFSAVNFIIPFLMILGSFGFMFGAGGSALIGKTLGEQNPEKANKLFSLLVYATLLCGIFFSIVGLITIRPIAIALGGRGEMLNTSIRYGQIILLALPFYMVQFEFQSFFVTAEKPTLGLVTTIFAGCTNMLLDWVFVGIFDWKVEGAALATAFSQAVGAIIPLIYFARKNTSLLRLGKAEPDWKALLKASTNGSSELMSNVAMSLVSMIYNAQLLKYAGEQGIAAYGVLMYVGMIFNAIFIGYAVGIAPVTSYHFGAKNKGELQSLLKKSCVITLLSSVVMFALSEGLAMPFSKLFVGYNAELLAMTHRGFVLFSFSFLFMGFAIYFSSFFTALNDGLTSALISFLRTLVFQIAAVLLLPLVWDIDGIWISITVAELMAMLTSLIFLFAKRKKYGYMK